MKIEEAKRKWEMILAKMKDDISAREYDEGINGLKEKLYLSVEEVDELLLAIKE